MISHLITAIALGSLNLQSGQPLEEISRELSTPAIQGGIHLTGILENPSETSVTRKPPEGVDYLRHSIRDRVSTYDTEKIKQIAFNRVSKISVSLFEDIEVVLELKMVRRSYSGALCCWGTIQGDPTSGFNLTLLNDRCVMDIEDYGEFRIKVIPISEKHCIVRELLPAPVNCFQNKIKQEQLTSLVKEKSHPKTNGKTNPKETKAATSKEEKPAKWIEGGQESMSQTSGAPQVDGIILYTPRALRQWEDFFTPIPANNVGVTQDPGIGVLGNVVVMTQALETQLNECLSNSYPTGQVSMEYNLIGQGLAPVDDSGYDTDAGSLQWLAELILSGANFSDEKHVITEMRGIAGADLCHVMLDIDDPLAGGCGFIIEDPESFFSPSLAYSCSLNNAAFTGQTFTHETGHNLGLDHNVENFTPAADWDGFASLVPWFGIATPFARGFHATGDIDSDGTDEHYGTIMSYEPQPSYNPNSGFSNDVNIRHFSSSIVNIGGEPTGVQGSSNCAFSISVTAYPTSQYYDRQPLSSEVHVNLNTIASVFEDGSWLHPFDTMAEALMKVQGDGTGVIKVTASSSPSPVGMVKRCRVISVGGTTTLGRD